MTIDTQKIIDFIPNLIFTAIFVFPFYLSSRKLRVDIKKEKEETQKKIVDDALEKQRFEDCIKKAQKDVDMAHTEIRHLKESNSRIENSVHQINFELKALLTGFNEIKLMLSKNLADNEKKFTEVHNRLDKHIESHIEVNR